jgi:hypothetical protein
MKRKLSLTYFSEVKVKLSLFLTNYAQRHKDILESRCIDPHFLDLGSRWRWVASFSPRPLYALVKSPQYPLDRGLSGSQSRSWRRAEVIIISPTGTQTPTPRSSSSYPVAIPTALSRLRRLINIYIYIYIYIYPCRLWKQLTLKITVTNM